MVAKKTWSFEAPPSPVPASSITEIITTDVVVLGSGAAGMVAAVSAAEAGAKTILLEKYQSFAAPGGGVGSINTSELLQKGMKTDVDVITQKLVLASEGRADSRLVKKWADNSGKTTDWLVTIANNAGVKIVKLGSDFEYTFGMPVFTGFIAEFYNMLQDYGKRFGLETRFSTQAIQLIRPNHKGRVTGVIAKNADGSYSQFNASKAVIICTGDYGSSPEMVEKYAPWASDCSNLYTIATNTGDGLRMALWAGALIDEPPHCAMIHFNSTNAKPPMMNRPVRAHPGNNPYLYVNKAGERFSNEALPYEYWSSLVLRQPGKTMWQVFDSKSINDKNREAVEKNLKTGEVLSANTIEDLAGKFGADPVKFKAAVSRYNEIVKMGKDPDFGKDPKQLGVAVDTSPFYVCESPPNLLVCMGGPKINENAQVLDTECNVIPGLYAAGNVCGGLWGDCYPMSILSGIARGTATTFGRIAGLHAAGS